MVSPLGCPAFHPHHLFFPLFCQGMGRWARMDRVQPPSGALGDPGACTWSRGIGRSRNVAAQPGTQWWAHSLASSPQRAAGDSFSNSNWHGLWATQRASRRYSLTWGYGIHPGIPKFFDFPETYYPNLGVKSFTHLCLSAGGRSFCWFEQGIHWLKYILENASVLQDIQK